MRRLSIKRYLSCMIEVNVDQAIKQLRRMNRHLSSAEMDTAIRMALNDAIRRSKTAIGRAIRRTYPETAFTPAATNAALIIHRAITRNLTAKLFVSGKPLPVTLFKPREDKGVGISVEIIKGRRKVIRSAFFAPIGRKKMVAARGKYSGNKFHFRKQRIVPTGSDLPIQRLLTVSLPGAVMSEQSQAIEDAARDAEAYLPARLQHHIKRVEEGVVRIR